MSNLYRRGENIFLYVQFKDENGNSIVVSEPEFKIISEQDEDPSSIFWESLFPLSEDGENNSEYYCNYVIPHDAHYGTYEIVYRANYEDKVARVIESFRVIPTSNIYENTIKVYGYVHQDNNSLPIQDVFVEIFTNNEKEIVYETRTNSAGYWEAHVYPDNYKFYFNKYGYLEVEFVVQVGYEHNEIQFNNVVMESEEKKKYGTGIYKVHDKYITKEGMEIFGLNVKAYNVASLSNLVAENTTDKDGLWELFLDPGIYLLKIDGYLYETPFREKFRLKVYDDGQFSFENLSSNVAVPVHEEYISPGDPNNSNNVEVSDSVIDKEGYPIVDVQINVFKKGDMNTIVAQDYTDSTGYWKVFLVPGNYVFEYYHPNFDVIMEERKISR
jgi:hypothetical protein